MQPCFCFLKEKRGYKTLKMCSTLVVGSNLPVSEKERSCQLRTFHNIAHQLSIERLLAIDRFPRLTRFVLCLPSHLQECDSSLKSGGWDTPLIKDGLCPMAHHHGSGEPCYDYSSDEFSLKLPILGGAESELFFECPGKVGLVVIPYLI